MVGRLMLRVVEWGESAEHGRAGGRWVISPLPRVSCDLGAMDLPPPARAIAQGVGRQRVASRNRAAAIRNFHHRAGRHCDVTVVTWSDILGLFMSLRRDGGREFQRKSPVHFPQLRQCDGFMSTSTRQRCEKTKCQLQMSKVVEPGRVFDFRSLEMDRTALCRRGGCGSFNSGRSAPLASAAGGYYTRPKLFAQKGLRRMSRSEKTIRIGAVRYLNTKPLVYRLTELAPQIDLAFDLPSRLADRLAGCELDVALIPTVEAMQNPDYVILSDACIACRGPVWSVKLFSRVPIGQIRTLALDEGSRTSAALVQILLAERAGVHPSLQPLGIGQTTADTQADAVLLIGDRAIHPPAERFAEVWDLGDEWCRWSELPFVFAMWTARRAFWEDEVPRHWEGEAPAEPESRRDEPAWQVGTSRLARQEPRPPKDEPRPPKETIADALAQARDEGLANLEAIARDEAATVGLTTRECLHYLRDNLHFTLGPREREGLKLFHEHAARLGLAPKELYLQFDECAANIAHP